MHAHPYAYTPTRIHTHIHTHMVVIRLAIESNTGRLQLYANIREASNGGGEVISNGMLAGAHSHCVLLMPANHAMGKGVRRQQYTAR